MKKTISILIFDGVEVMDFAGPFEVFSTTNELNDYAYFDIKVVAKYKAPVITKNGLSINPAFSIAEIQQSEILIIPGGDGTRHLLGDNDILDWVKKINQSTELTLSVCSGALILAKARLLDGRQATTHHEVFEALAEIAPNTQIKKGVRFVDNGKIITSAGISAGIDMSLYVINKLYGDEVSQATSAYMEYETQTGQSANG